MSSYKLQAIVLAAGQSSRFNTSLTKLSFTLCGREIITYPVQLLTSLDIPVTLVIGYQKELIKTILDTYSLTVTYVEQHKQAGTGHAVLCTQENWHADHILIINGDMPLVTSDIITELIERHLQTQAIMTFVTSHNTDPSVGSYGRVIKQENITRIVEAHDFIGDTQIHCCLNAGIYIIDKAFLQEALAQLQIHTNTEQFYITDLAEIASKQGYHVETITAPFDYVRGINTLKELWAAEHIKRSDIINHFMSKGVRFDAAQTVHIDLDVTIETDTRIGAGVQLRGTTHIGSQCMIDAYSIISNSIIEDQAIIYSHSIISNSTISAHAQVGPFAHIRTTSKINHNAIVGNFVEVTKSTLGAASKAKHLAYVGNTTIGTNSNIGAGVITCNYNGIQKHKTLIGDHVFIGANSTLIAPVEVASQAIVAAGSVITENVPKEALAISRTNQITKEHYAPKLKQKYANRIL